MAWSWRRSRTAARHALAREQVAAPVPQLSPTAPGADAGVHLGFADGSEVALPANDPRAAALQAVADVLVRGRA